MACFKRFAGNESSLCCLPVNHGVGSIIETIITLGRGVGASVRCVSMNDSLSHRRLPTQTPTLLMGPMPFSRERHSLYDFECGQHRINELVHEIGDFSEIYPNSSELISVYTHGTPRDVVQPVIACASGKVVNYDDINRVRHAPRIEISLVAVDNGFQGMGLSAAIALDVVERLYRDANARDVELRMMEVASSRARGLWERSGFQIVPHTDERSPDMRMRLNPSSLAMLRQRWQPRPRPGYEIVRAAHHLQLG